MHQSWKFPPSPIHRIPYPSLRLHTWDPPSSLENPTRPFSLPAQQEIVAYHPFQLRLEAIRYLQIHVQHPLRQAVLR